MPTRYTYEQQLAEAISEQLAEDLRYLRELGEPMPDFWEREKKKLIETILPIFAAAMFWQMQEVIDAPELPFVDFDNFMSIAQAWASNYAYDLVSGIVDRSAVALQSAFSSFFAGNIGEQELISKISYWFNPYRADNIAITEITRAVEKARDFIFEQILKEHPELMLDEYWVTAGDERVCEICAPLDGKKRGDGWYSAPPADPRCVLPGNYVMPIGDISAATQSHFSGNIIEITFDSGRIISITENHPILTQRGWVRGKFLNSSNDSAYSAIVERKFFPINPNYQQSPTRIEDIFTSFKESGKVTTRSMPVSPEDFNGDGRFINSDINIIYSNRFLLRNRISSLFERIGKNAFNWANTNEFFLNGYSCFNHLVPGWTSAASGKMRSGDLMFSLSHGHSSPFGGFGFGLRSGNNSVSDKHFSENAPANTDLARKFILGFPGNISLDKIIKIKNYNFIGHVYDLQCDLFELYTCNDIITHNCRCSREMKLGYR
jgi:hypothetical protein